MKKGTREEFVAEVTRFLLSVQDLALWNLERARNEMHKGFYYWLMANPTIDVFVDACSNNTRNYMDAAIKAKTMTKKQLAESYGPKDPEKEREEFAAWLDLVYPECRACKSNKWLTLNINNPDEDSKDKNPLKEFAKKAIPAIGAYIRETDENKEAAKKLVDELEPAFMELYFSL